MTAEQVRGLRISWMTGAEQEVEVILVREGKTKEKGTEAEKERNRPTEEATVSHKKPKRKEKEGIQTHKQETQQKCGGQKRKKREK